MIIHVKNKNTLIIDDFKLKCCIGKNGLNSKKIEGDYSLHLRGLFNLNKLYFRERSGWYPKCNLTKKIIKKIWLGVMIQTIKNIMKKLKI